MNQQPKFEFKCISMQIGVAKAPLDTPSLRMINPAEDNSGKAIRVLSLLFDTSSNTSGSFKSIEDSLSQTKLSSFLCSAQIDLIKDNYKTFVMGLAHKYLKEDKVKHFPFEIKNTTGGQV